MLAREQGDQQAGHLAAALDEGAVEVDAQVLERGEGGGGGLGGQGGWGGHFDVLSVGVTPR